MTEKINELIPLLTEYGIRVLGVILLLIVAKMVAGWTKNVAYKSFSKGNLDETLSMFLAKMLGNLVLLVAVLAVLGIFGIQTTSFAAVIAAAGLAVGLAFQGTLGNFAAGIMLLVFRPFKVGDVVSVSGTTGKVVEIGLFVTSFDTPDNRRIIMGNGSIAGSTIENITFHDTRRVDVAVGVEYGADLKQVREVLETLVKDVAESKGLTDPAPVVYHTELADSSVNYALRVWAKTPDYWAVREMLTTEVKLRLDAAGIGIPFPQLDLHVVENVSAS